MYTNFSKLFLTTSAPASLPDYIFKVHTQCLLKQCESRCEYGDPNQSSGGYLQNNTVGQEEYKESPYINCWECHTRLVGDCAIVLARADVIEKENQVSILKRKRERAIAYMEKHCRFDISITSFPSIKPVSLSLSRISFYSKNTQTSLFLTQ